MGDRIDILQPYQLVGQQAQGPARPARGGLPAHQRHQARFLLPIEFSRPQLAVRLAPEGRGDARFHKHLAHPADRGETDIERLDNRLIFPGGSVGAFIRFE